MKRNLVLFFILLFIVIGVATVTTSLVLNLNTSIAKNVDDFLIYFSNVKVDGVLDLSLVKNERELIFDAEFVDIGDKKIITYDVTNASTQYDAEISFSCTKSNLYINVINAFDTDKLLSAGSTRTGTLTIELISAVTEKLTQNRHCLIDVSAVEKTTVENISSIPVPIERSFNIGDEVSIGKEKFYIISDNGESVTLFTKYPLHTLSSVQMEEQVRIVTSFSDGIGWESDSEHMEIDFQQWGGYSKAVVNDYVSYLEDLTGDNNIYGDFITLSQLRDLGCSITDDYSWQPYNVCRDSPYVNWIVLDDYYWWTRSRVMDTPDRIWVLSLDGWLSSYSYDDSAYIRPTITISKETLINYDYYNSLWIGKEILIGSERFNVVRYDEENITLLAKYNLGSNFKQSEKQHYVNFANYNGWEYTPGPKEINIQQFDGDVKNYINEYVLYLRSETDNNNIYGDLLTFSDLKELDCVVSDDYNDISNEDCFFSRYYVWLDNGQSWWTRSAYPSDMDCIWGVDDLNFSKGYFNSVDKGERFEQFGVRPIVIVPRTVIGL